MKVKRYIGNDTQETMLKIKTELGPNAVILHSRKIKKPGIFGFMKKPLIEMVAAIEENKTKLNTQIIKTNRESENMPSNSFDNRAIDTLKDQVGNIENLLSNVLNKIGYENEQKQDENDMVYQKYLNILIENDIEREFAAKILNIVKKQVSFTEQHHDAIINAIRIAIREYLDTPSTINDGTGSQKTVVFVGPTGVGKTTTLAKLAAKLSIAKGKRVGVITADTYRIAAVEQLKTYSEILSIPIKVIYEPKEIQEAISAYRDKDIILIDTAGRNHKKEDQLEEVKNLFRNIVNPEIYLVISATTGYKDIVNIIKSYDFLDNYNIIFTKLDEASSKGNILNAKLLTGKSLSYITTGQSVPDDLEIAHPEVLANMIVGEIHE